MILFRIVQKIAGLLFFSVAIQLCACSEKPETPKKVMVEPIYQSYEIPLPPKDCQTEEQETVDTIQSTLSSEVINKVSEWEQKFPKSLLTNAIIVKQFDELKDDSEEHLARIQKLEMICPKWASVHPWSATRHPKLSNLSNIVPSRCLQSRNKCSNSFQY